MTTTSPSPLADAPDWVASWIAGPIVIDAIRARAPFWPEEVQAALIRFPFDCVVRCACGSAACKAPWMIVLGVGMGSCPIHRKVVVFVRHQPEGPISELVLDRCRFDLMAVRGGLDGNLMQILLRPAADA